MLQNQRIRISEEKYDMTGVVGWEGDAGEQILQYPLLVVKTEKRLFGPIRMKGHRFTPGGSHWSRRNGVGEEAFGSNQSEWITKRSGQVCHAHLRKREKLKKKKKKLADEERDSS